MGKKKERKKERKKDSSVETRVIVTRKSGEVFFILFTVPLPFALFSIFLCFFSSLPSSFIVFVFFLQAYFVTSYWSSAFFYLEVARLSGKLVSGCSRGLARPPSCGGWPFILMFTKR